jgi:hypothetical protein
VPAASRDIRLVRLASCSLRVAAVGYSIGHAPLLRAVAGNRRRLTHSASDFLGGAVTPSHHLGSRKLRSISAAGRLGPDAYSAPTALTAGLGNLGWPDRLFVPSKALQRASRASHGRKGKARLHAAIRWPRWPLFWGEVVDDVSQPPGAPRRTTLSNPSRGARATRATRDETTAHHHGKRDRCGARTSSGPLMRSM